MVVFLFTNGSPAGRAALDFGIELAAALQAPVRLIGLRDGRGTGVLGRLGQEVRRATERLHAAGVSMETATIDGRAEDVVPAQVGADSLAVLGPQGRSGWLRWLRGSSIRHVLHEVSTPVIYVANPPARPVRRMLICSGGLSHAQTALRLGGRIASALRLPVTLLHIVVPTLNLPAEVQDEAAPPAEYLQGETIFARNLRQAAADLERAGLAVEFRLRTGDPLTEILSEVREGDYGMVAVGSHGVLSGPARLVGDITASLVEGAGCPVLVAPGPAEESAVD